jgi:hypothetical protein
MKRLLQPGTHDPKSQVLDDDSSCQPKNFLDISGFSGTSGHFFDDAIVGKAWDFKDLLSCHAARF